MSSIEPETAPEIVESLGSRLRRDVDALDGELAEIDLLVQQARVEAERHELKRSQAAEKLDRTTEATPLIETVALATQLVTLTRRATLMESQVEVLEGKRKTLARLRDRLSDLVATQATGTGELDSSALESDAGGQRETRMSAGTTRIVLTAQEDLRREIARQMHDGPAQSLTNIVLQAQIVERLLSRDPEMARDEVRQLIAMVQHTLDATKSFIFDVRPMVLDDLGLVPTVRRGARERGRRAGIAVEFESMGTDRRMPMEIESGLFRIIDEAIVAYLQSSPDRVRVRLDWTDDRLEGRVSATRFRSEAVVEAEKEAASHVTREPVGQDLPPALASMMADRREQAEAAVEAARSAAVVVLPAAAWREIQQRATTAGITAELVGGGGELQFSVELASAESPNGS